MKVVRIVLGVLLAPLAFAANVDDWVLRMDGIGPARVGMRYAQANSALGGILHRDDASIREACEEIAVPGHEGIGLMFIDDVLVRVDVWRKGGRTDRGVAVGDPAQRVLDTYHDVATERHAYDERERYYTVTSPDHTLAVRFETREGKIAGFYAGRYRAVQYIEGCL